MSRMIALHVVVPPDVREWLRTKAEIQGLTVGAVTRQVLERVIDSEPGFQHRYERREAQVRRLRRQGLKLMEIASQFGISEASVSRILSGTQTKPVEVVRAAKARGGWAKGIRRRFVLRPA